MYIEYIDHPDYVTLYRMYGGGPVAEIPAQVDGRPVRELADHVFAAEPSVLYDRKQIRRAAVPDGTDDPGTDKAAGETAGEALCGESIEVIRIPEGVEQIGNYAFYGCRALREVSFPSTLRRIGYGMFNVCQQVSRLVFTLAGQEGDFETPAIMKEVLDAVSNEVEAVVMRDGQEMWRLLFPGYYEEGKENTPARIIEIVYYGTGHQYRNCFLNRKIQFDRYDEVFPLAAAQESSGTDIRLIQDRLRSGVPPKEDSRKRYIDYLRSEAEALIRAILQSREYDPVRELGILDRNGYFTSTQIDLFISAASAAGRSDAVSFLMNMKKERFRERPGLKYEL